MKLLSFARDGEPRLGALTGEGGVVDLAAAYAALLRQRGVVADQRLAAALLPSDMSQFLANGPLGQSAAREALDFAVKAANAPGSGQPLVHPLAEVRLLAPLCPPKIIGIGRNYEDHLTEAGGARQENPRIFFKLTQSVIGPGDPIRRGVAAKLDYEAELAVVMGRRVKGIQEEEAWSAIAGYTLANDVTAREMQQDVKPPQTSFGKSFDSFTPLGPWVVTADEFATPPRVELKCWVNGDLRIHGETGNLIFGIAHLVAYIAQRITLEPGDVILTGTPAGVGAYYDPPRFLKAGDQVRISGSGIGELANPVVDG